MPDRRRGLPPLALGALYVLVSVTPMIVAGVTGEGHRLGLVRAATATGMAGAVALFLQMLTSGRFEAISGRIGIDVTMAFHRWAAPVALALASLHVLCLIGPPDPSRPHRLEHRLAGLLTSERLGDARWALAILAVLVLAALARDRLPVRYEAWRASHGILALALIGLVLSHVLTDGRGGTRGFWMLLAASAIVPAASVHLRRLTATSASDWTLERCREVADRIWELELRRPSGEALPFRAGQFAWVSFGSHRLPLFDHPFSFASAPGDPVVRLLVQEAGDFTREVGRLPPGTRVTLDGPHGSFGLDAEGGDVILLIAGGVGVAPILSVLGDLASRGTTRTVRLIYAGRHPHAMLGPELLHPSCERLGITPMLLADRDADTAGMAPGPLDETHLREALEGVDRSKIQALVCGPGPMMTFATDTLARLGVSLRSIGYERFSYAATTLSAKDRRTLTGFVFTWAAVAVAALVYALA
jgi:predicted ferric reductase